MPRSLHIILPDVPYPADYGGVIDPFHMLRSLAEAGVGITLHCFYKPSRPPARELEKYCRKIFWYPRNMRIAIFSRLPFIVASRPASALLKNISADNEPILMQGLHCTGLLLFPELQQRKTFLRAFNVEHTYYRRLAANEPSLWRRIFFRIESMKLRRYEQRLPQQTTVLALSTTDATYFRHECKLQTHFLPAFLPEAKIDFNTGLGNYCLYQANLSVNENEQAALWLIKDVFNGLSAPLIIAGKSPSAKLTAAAAKAGVQLIADPPAAEMEKLIRAAQINVLPSFNATGVKLKLLQALQIGRFCIANPAGVAGSGVEDCCEIANTAEEFRAAINRLFTKEFDESTFESRRKKLDAVYDNEKNRERLNAWIW